MNKTLEQIRAADALEKVNELRVYDEDWKDKYASYVSSLSPTILTNGLGQAAATLLSAGEKGGPHRVLYDHLEGWLCRNDNTAPYRNFDAGLMKAITDHDREDYMKAQAEALAWLQWLKKFAAAYLKKLESDNL